MLRVASTRSSFNVGVTTSISSKGVPQSAQGLNFKATYGHDDHHHGHDSVRSDKAPKWSINSTPFYTKSTFC